MTKYRIVEILCVIFAVVFIVSSVAKKENTEKNAAQISENLLPKMEDGALIERDASFFREKFDIDPTVFSSFVYYSSDDVMNVNELFVAVCSEKVPADIIDGFTVYSQDRYNLFNGYAPEQAEYLKNCAILSECNAVIFCVGKNAAEISSLFSESL